MKRILWLLPFCLGVFGADGNRYFEIQVVDDQTGRGVPMVRLESVAKMTWWTDSQGRVAFLEPGLMNREVYFHVSSDGYEMDPDGFGYRGVQLTPLSGESAVVRVRRVNIAERLYRVTGQGIYRDTVLLGRRAPTREPLLNGRVVGQDTVIVTPYRGRLSWFWGDTDRPGYPLGHFGASGAVSELPETGGLDPGVGVDLEYFTDESGFSRPMCPLPGKGLRWIEAVVALKTHEGREQLVARVANMKNLGTAIDWHLMVFNDAVGRFESVKRWDIREPHDSSHPFKVRVGGETYLYLYGNWRVPASIEALSDLTRYEAFTCVSGDGRLRGGETQIDRDSQGRAVYTWKAGADRLRPGRIAELVRLGRMKREESWRQLIDFETGAPVSFHRGSICWNQFRRCWVMIASAKPGEIWYAEADTPCGPWVYARRIVSHQAYNFYHPTQHAFFDQEGGRRIYFEGTYTSTFSAAHEKTPLYDYNQIMYGLSLDDERLNLPAPVYRMRGADASGSLAMSREFTSANDWDTVEEVAFFAVPGGRPGRGLVPVSWVEENGERVLRAGGSSNGVDGDVLFRALAAGGGRSVGPVRPVDRTSGRQRVLCLFNRNRRSIRSRRCAYRLSCVEKPDERFAA